MTTSLPRPDLRWTAQGPWSATAGDSYHARDPEAQVRRVFLGLNRLPERFAACRATFHLAETGFGTGLTFASAAGSFLQQAPPGARLLYTSVEHAPPEHDQLAGIRARRRHLDPVYAALCRAWPPRLPGWHRRSLFGGRVLLCLYFGDAQAGFDSLADDLQPVDAWCLDGFAPDRNPELWNTALFTALAARSHARTTLATYTAAGAVRRGLAAAGFRVERVDGTPLKRHWLRGQAQQQGQRCRAPGWCPDPVLVAGGGLAGACAARALAEAGVPSRVLAPPPPADSAPGSANPAAALHVRLPRAADGLLAWRASAFSLAAQWLSGRPGFTDLPVLQRPGPAVDRQHLAQGLALATRLGPWVRPVAAAEAAAVAGCPLPVAEGELALFPRGGWADLPRLCRALLDHPSIQRLPGPLPSAPVQDWADANDCASTLLSLGPLTLAQPGLPALRQGGRVRGQVSRFALPGHSLRAVLSGDGYLIPAGGHLWAGATFERTPTARLGRDQAISENRARVQRLAGVMASAATGHWAGERSTTPDRLPLVGAVPGLRGVLLLSGLGASGLLHAPLAAQVLAARLAGQPPALPDAAGGLVDPARGALRGQD